MTYGEESAHGCPRSHRLHYQWSCEAVVNQTTACIIFLCARGPLGYVRSQKLRHQVARLWAKVARVVELACL